MKQIYKNEIHKFIWNKRVVFVLLVGILLEIIMAAQIRIVMFDGYHKSVYQYYMEKIQGVYQWEKKEYIDSEYEKQTELIDKAQDYERQYQDNLMSGRDYHEISDQIKTAQYRIKTLEYIKEKAEYFDDNHQDYSFFYDIELSDYIKYMNYDLIAIIVVVLLVIPIYTEDYYAGTIPMIRSSQYGKEILFGIRLKIGIIFSAIVSLTFSFVEFMVKYIKYDITNLNAKLGSLMIQTESIPNCMNDLPIWNYIVVIWLLRLIVASLIGAAGVIVTKNIIDNA